MMFLTCNKKVAMLEVFYGTFSKNNTFTLKQYKNSDLPTPFHNEIEIGNKTIFRHHMQNEKNVNRIPGSATIKKPLTTPVKTEEKNDQN